MTTRTDVRAWVVIDAEIWKRSHESHRHDVMKWLRLNGIDPADVPADSTVLISETADGSWEIRHEGYLRSDSGNIRTDPDHPSEAFVEERSTPLELDPPLHWLVPVAEQE